MITAVIVANRVRPEFSEARGLRSPDECLPPIVPLWLIRQIDRELKSNEYDPSIFHGACDGLGWGSGRFEEAYIAARLQGYTKRSMRTSGPIHLQQPVHVTIMPKFRGRAEKKLPNSFTRPMAVLHGGHLMQHFGVWIVCLLTLQALSAWKIGAFAEFALGSGRHFHSAIWLILMLALDLRTWFRYYGRDAEEFRIPGLFLFLSATLPVFLLHLLAFLQ